MGLRQTITIETAHVGLWSFGGKELTFTYKHRNNKQPLFHNVIAGISIGHRGKSCCGVVYYCLCAARICPRTLCMFKYVTTQNVPSGAVTVMPGCASLETPLSSTTALNGNVLASRHYNNKRLVKVF